MVRAVPELRTRRLLLRAWRDEDREPFAALNADPTVMEHFPSTLTREQSDARAARISEAFATHGFGLWAAELPGLATFIGEIGLAVPSFDAPFTPCVEVGWRLAHGYWGQGYATEGARAALTFAFQVLRLDQVVAMTTPANVRSQRVMSRIGMARDLAADFDHPLVPQGNPARRHVLYRISAEAWHRGASANLVTQR